MILLNEQDLIETGFFTMEQIRAAKHNGDGHVGTIHGEPYFLLEAELNLETGKRVVEMPDMMGDGKNRIAGANGKPRE